MKKNIFVAAVLLLSLTSRLIAQTPTPTPQSPNEPAEQRITRMQQEIDLMKKQQEYEKAKSDLANRRLKEILENLPESSIKPLSGKTTFSEEKEIIPESAALSYEALKELSAKISQEMKTDISSYKGLVIYNEPDFVFLAKYRLYRNQARIALQNYDQLIDVLKKITQDTALPDSKSNGKIRIKSTDPLMTALSIPSIGTAYATSIAQLFSVFRNETTITQSQGKVDNGSFGAVLANDMRKMQPGLKIFYPQAFVAEYELEESEGTLISQIAQVNAANFILGEVLVQIAALPEAQRTTEEIKGITALTDVVQKQLQSVTLSGKGASNAESSENDSAANLSEFRQLLRAEKLNRFLLDKPAQSAGKTDDKENSSLSVGILKLRVLSSGGSRREKNNLFLGNKIDYSGSIIVEVMLFDADGTLKRSDVFSLHTGFRKMKPNKST